VLLPFLLATGLINTASPGTRLLRWKVKRSVVMITPKPQQDGFYPPKLTKVKKAVS